MRCFLLSVLLLVSNAAWAQVRVHCDFAGGNILVKEIKGDRVRVAPDMRDTDGKWFYWCFAVEGAEGRTLEFVFPKGNFTRAGVSVSVDGGMTWHWEQPEAFANNKFKYSFATNEQVRFSMGIPYTQTNWELFVEKYKKSRNYRPGVLAVTKKGREVEMAVFDNPCRRSKYKLVLTARHHACEMMANYVIEGILDGIMQDRWLRNNVEALVIPFVDKDGVEDGDQGKKRIPRDHNRDYREDYIYESVGAIMALLPEWTGGGRNIAIDCHCPWIRSKHNETIFIMGAEDSLRAAKQLHFSDLIAKNNEGELEYSSENFIHHNNRSWSKAPEARDKFSYWAWSLPGNELSFSLEITYGVNGEQLITADNAREFGRDVARALKEYMNKKERHRRSRGEAS